MKREKLSMRSVKARLWGGPHDGLYCSVTITLNGPPDAVDVPPVTAQVPLLLESASATTSPPGTLRYRLDPEYDRDTYLLYRLESAVRA